MAENSIAHRQTFLFADLAGFTALTEAHGDSTAADLVIDFASRTQRLVDEAGASQIKTIGDGLMIRAPTPSVGVRLAARIAAEVGGRHGFPAVRMGVHTGTAVERDGDWFGAGVNVASRIAALATASEVLVSEETAASASTETFELLGAVELRNVALPVTIYRLGKLSSALSVDPVCRMLLAQERAVDKGSCDDGVRYFCSTACAEVFASNPGRFC